MGTAGDNDTLFTLSHEDPRPAAPGRSPARQSVAGLLLVVTAIGAAWQLPGLLTQGPLQSGDTVLVADGEPHRAETSAERDSMLWLAESGSDPGCVVRDGVSGDALPTEPADRTDRRFRDNPGDWIGVATFEPTSASVEITCAEATGMVLVSQAPGGSAGLLAIGTIILVPLTLALGGLVLLTAAATSVVQNRFAARV